MVNVIEQAIDTFYDKVMTMPNKVLSIFNNFFGEERVDMQGFYEKRVLRCHILALTLSDIFNSACMKDKLPLIGVNSNNSLIDINTESIPIESAELIAEAISSYSFADSYSGLGDGFILVHFPRTVVTNEHDRSTVVNHLYVKVPITSKGAENGLFTMNRSEYTVAEIYSDYMHSHASHIPLSNFRDFVGCCLGSGPLNGTQTYLSAGFDEDRWNLFCLELSKYVEVESIAGRPYHYLEKINFSTDKVENIDKLYNKPNFYLRPGRNRNDLLSTLKDFFIYYLDNNNLTFSFRNGVYSLGMPFIEYLIHLSNSFIEWVNSKPELEKFESGFSQIIKKYIIKDEELYEDSTHTNHIIERFRQYVGREICTFKNNPVTVTITDLERIEINTSNKVRLIDPSLASTLLNRILRTLNYRYGRNQEDPNSIIGKVRYKI